MSIAKKILDVYLGEHYQDFIDENLNHFENSEFLENEYDVMVDITLQNIFRQNRQIIEEHLDFVCANNDESWAQLFFNGFRYGLVYDSLDNQSISVDSIIYDLLYSTSCTFYDVAHFIANHSIDKPIVDKV